MAGRAGLTAALPGWAALSAALPFVGSGPLNGDIAAYAAQVSAGDLSDRWTHLGYLLLARLITPGAGDALLPALDLLSWLSAMAVVGAVAARVQAAGGSGALAGLGAAAVLLPWAALAEVDLPWVAAAVLAAGGRAAWMAVAIAISPAALLALPAVGALSPGERRGRLLAWTAGTIAALTLFSRGDWWVGERGVLAGEALMPGRTLQGLLLHLPWPLLLLLPRASWRWLPAFAPLLLAPPDVPVWLLPGVGIAAAVAKQPSGRWLPAAVALQLLVGLGEGGARIAQVRSERAMVERAAALLGPGDGLCAPFTWGARVAVARTGDPYGFPWHPPGRFLREQRLQWCEARPVRVAVLPPGQDGAIGWRELEPLERCP